MSRTPTIHEVPVHSFLIYTVRDHNTVVIHEGFDVRLSREEITEDDEICAEGMWILTQGDKVTYWLYEDIDDSRTRCYHYIKEFGGDITEEFFADSEDD